MCDGPESEWASPAERLPSLWQDDEEDEDEDEDEASAEEAASAAAAEGADAASVLVGE